MALKHRGRDWIGLRLSVISNRYTYPLYAAIERDHGLLRDEAAVIVCLSFETGRRPRISSVTRRDQKHY